MRKYSLPLVLVVLMCIVVVSVRAINVWLQGDNPAYIVRIKYEALSKKDQTAYLSTIMPESRSQAATLHSLASALTSAFIHLDPFEMNYGDWMNLVAGMNMTYHDMSYSIIERTDQYALVKATGYVAFGSVDNLRFCIYQDVRKVDGQWYNDEYSAQGIQRMQEQIKKKMQLLQEIEYSDEDSRLEMADVQLMMNSKLWHVLFDFC